MLLTRFTLPITFLFCLLINLNGQTAPTRSSSSTQNVSAGLNVRSALEDYFRKVAGLGFSGAVLVYKDGEVLLRKGYGWADVKRRIPIAPDTIFDIGSGVKAFTATAIMQLEEQGKLNTSDLMTKYIKDVPPDKSNITIHQLLTHTSGLNFDYAYDMATKEERAIMADRDRYIKGVLSHPLAFKPGEGRVYSNTGFSLLAIIIENVSGEPYEQYVSEHLFKPAGMIETGYYIPHDLRRVSHGYNDGDTDYGYPWETQWAGNRPLWDLMGNGGMLTTVDDVYKWMAAIKGEKIVSQKSKDKMFQVYYPNSDQGYGWNVAQTEGRPFVWRGGDAVPQGWNCEFRWYKTDDLIAVILTNRRIRAGSIRRYSMPNLIDIALFNKPPQLPAFTEVASAKLRRLEGTYKLESGAHFHVKAAEAATGDARTKPVLMISGEGQQAIDLLFSGAQLSGLEKLSRELNDKTSHYIEALRKNDLTALKTILPASSSPEDAVKRWNDFVKLHGALEQFEILGTSPLNQSGVQTFIRLKFRKAGGVYKVTWRDQKLWEQDEDRLQPEITEFLRKSFVVFPLNLPFLPQSETDFATYDPFKGRTINVSFSKGKLIVHRKDGDAVAQKVKTE
ncbi:MAG TPA: serine hydrolase domain-containing protein [Pyrinomonadaceae bacterium]|nr:serine hydrolase domain-containing protein [Pyrinomonadaceae bacterium]